MALTTVSATFAQDCLIDYDIEDDLSITSQEEIANIAVDGDRLAVLVLPRNMSGTPGLQPASIRIMQRVAATGRYTQVADIDLGVGISGCEFSRNAKLDLEGNTVLLFEGGSNSNATGCAEVFYLTLPNAQASTPALFDGGNLNTGFATVNGIPNVTTAASFGRDAELVTVGGQVLAYIGDPLVRPNPIGGVIRGAVYVYDVTAPAVNPGAFAPAQQVGGFADANQLFEGFGESLAVAAAPGGTQARIIVGSRFGLQSGNPLTSRGDVRFWNCTANAGGGYTHQPAPSVNSTVLVEQNSRAGHVSISNDWAFVEVLEQFGGAGPNAAPGRTEVYRRRPADGVWVYQAGLDFEGNESLVAATGDRGLTVRTQSLNGVQVSMVVEVTSNGTSWSASSLMHPDALYTFTSGNPTAPGVLGESLSATAAGRFGRLWSFDCFPGTPFCTANPNYTGAIATTSTTGSAAVFANNFGLRAESLPPNQFGIFLVGFTPLQPPVLAGNGLLCLNNPLRYDGPGQILNSGPTGVIELPLDLSALLLFNGSPSNPVVRPVVAGETLRFQAWYRDFAVSPTTGAFVPTGNFARPVEMLFR